MSLERRAAALRDADGQLCRHLSDKRVEDEMGRGFMAWRRVASCRMFIGSCKGMVYIYMCVCACQLVCASGTVARCDTFSPAVVPMWLQNERDGGGLRFSSPLGLSQARPLSEDDKID